eukprot:Clim_evm12s147 gene=Clim_evmTU12s147
MDIDVQQFMDELKELIEIPSATKDVAACEKTLDWVEQYFGSTEYTYSRQREYDDANPILYVKPKNWRGDEEVGPRCLLLVHLDVVPMEAGYAMSEKDNILYGRGVSDMKGPGLILMDIMRRMKNPEIHLLVVTDEETGGNMGAKWCFETRENGGLGLTCRICICPDGGDGDNVVIAEKGVLRVNIRAEGKSAHSAYPWLGDNAIDKLMAALRLVEGMSDFNQYSEDNKWFTTLQVTKIAGGTAINQVPGSASADCDIRYTEQWTATSLREHITTKLKEAFGDTIKVSSIFEQPMLNIDKESVYVKIGCDVIREIVGKEPELLKGNGTSDGHWAPFPVIMTKPTGGGLHQHSEWVDKLSLLGSHKVFAEIIKRYVAVEQ